jgi:hypothetical protein
VKRALLVGIDSYRALPPLRGCVADVDALTPLLRRHEDGSPNFATRVLRGTAERGVLRDELYAALTDLLAPATDVALLYFAGHGVPAGGDVALAVTDGTPTTPGVRLTEVFELLRNERRPPEVLVMLDCCLSGAAGTVPLLADDLALLAPGLFVLAASRADQSALESPSGRGLFSGHLEGALNGGAADVLGSITPAGLYAYLSESFGAWDQRPVLRANVERMVEVRRCAPSVPLPVLRRLPEWFPAPDAEFPLDPSYEPEAEPADPEHEEIFAMLQLCRAAKLVEPVGEAHMYFAAIRSRSCRLTPLGRHYRQMADRELL